MTMGKLYVIRLSESHVNGPPLMESRAIKAGIAHARSHVGLVF